jgi:hypothetical protein
MSFKGGKQTSEFADERAAYATPQSNSELAYGKSKLPGMPLKFVLARNVLT